MPTEHKTGNAERAKTDERAKPASRIADVRLAIAFLTRLPVGSFQHPRSLAEAAWAFPLVGVLVGGFGVAALYGAGLAGLPSPVAALLAVAAMALVTGALHEDGLADVADGFGGGAVKTRKLEIMRDSRIGSYGVLGLVFVVGLKVAALAALGDVALAAAAVLTAAAVSRGLLPALMAALPMARDDGLAHGAGRPSRFNAGVALAVGAGVAIFMMSPHLVAAVFMLAAAALAALAVGMLAQRQIGGQTGDVLGAAQQVAETAILLTAVAVLS